MFFHVLVFTITVTLEKECVQLCYNRNQNQDTCIASVPV